MKKWSWLIAFLLVMTVLLCGCGSTGEKEGTGETSLPVFDKTGKKDMMGEESMAEGAALPVYDTTVGNIYTEITGDYALTVGVNQSENSTLDTIILGDDESCNAHGVVVKDPIRGEDIYGEGYLQMSSSENYLTFQVAVDPSSYNYITVKLWGGEHGYNTAMILYSENSADLRDQTYGSAWTLLDYRQDEAMQDGTYYYATYRLPILLTHSKTEVTLQLRHFGNVDTYDSNGDGILYTETDKASRRIYRIYSHSDPWYDRMEQGAVGVKEEVAENTFYEGSQSVSAYEEIYDWVNATAETVISWQLYGETFEENVKAGRVPEMARGALLKGGKANAEYADMNAFASAYYSKVLNGNGENIQMMYAMALAYILEGNAYYQSEDLLERMCALWDFYVRAQGSNGGFGSSQSNWIGLSDNEGAGYNSEGRQAANSIIAAGERSVAETFVLLYEAVEATGLLDQQVDYNLDGKLEDTEVRRTAYYNMFCDGAGYGAEFVNRQCVNQDLHNISMFYHFQKAACLLGEAPYSQEYVLRRLYAGLGIVEHTYPLPDGTQYSHGGWQFSTKSALALETFGHAAGGYCGSYGMICTSILCNFAYDTQDELLIAQALKSLESNAYFFDRVTGSAGVSVLIPEGVLGTRKVYTPGSVAFSPNQNFLAVTFGSEPAKKMLELYLQSGYWKTEFSAFSKAHGADTFRRLADLVTVEGLKEYLQTPAGKKDENGISYRYDTGTDFILPSDIEFGDFVWTDEMARCVVLRNGDDFLRMTLNWRMEYNGDRVYENATVNNVLRVHGWNTNEVYTATVNMKSPFGFGGIYTARYGDYTIIMNSSEKNSYEITLVGNGVGYTIDLVSGEKVPFESAITLIPQSSMVLVTNAGEARTPMAASEIVNPEVSEIVESWDE